MARALRRLMQGLVTPAGIRTEIEPGIRLAGIGPKYRQGAGPMTSKQVQQPPPTDTDHKNSAASHRHPRYWLHLLIAVVVIAASLFLGSLSRLKRDKQVHARANRQKNALPIVQVVTAQQMSKTEELTLPGTVVPVWTTRVYSGAVGYVKAPLTSALTVRWTGCF